MVDVWELCYNCLDNVNYKILNRSSFLFVITLRARMKICEDIPSFFPNMQLLLAFPF